MPVPLGHYSVAALGMTIPTCNGSSSQYSIPASITPFTTTMPAATYAPSVFAHPVTGIPKSTSINEILTGETADFKGQDNGEEGDRGSQLTIDSGKAFNISNDTNAGEAAGDVRPSSAQRSSLSEPFIAQPNYEKASAAKVCDRCKTTIGKPADKVLSQRAAEQPTVAPSRDDRKSVNDESWETVKKVGMGYAFCVCGLLLSSGAGVAYSKIQKARGKDREKAAEQTDAEMAQEGEEQKKHKKGN